MQPRTTHRRRGNPSPSRQCEHFKDCQYLETNNSLCKQQLSFGWHGKVTECSPWASPRVAKAEESVNMLDTVGGNIKVAGSVSLGDGLKENWKSHFTGINQHSINADRGVGKAKWRSFDLEPPRCGCTIILKWWDLTEKWGCCQPKMGHRWKKNALNWSSSYPSVIWHHPFSTNCGFVHHEQTSPNFLDVHFAKPQEILPEAHNLSYMTPIITVAKRSIIICLAHC